MAITALRLDGQTLGLQLDAASPSVDVLSLDITTGTVTSAYLTDVDVRNLKATVDELFALVPLASRAAGALNLLTKFAAVSSADATSVTLSAVNTVGTTYALRATHAPPHHTTTHNAPSRRAPADPRIPAVCDMATCAAGSGHLCFPTRFHGAR